MVRAEERGVRSKGKAIATRTGVLGDRRATWLPHSQRKHTIISKTLKHTDMFMYSTYDTPKLQHGMIVCTVPGPDEQALNRTNMSNKRKTNK